MFITQKDYFNVRTLAVMAYIVYNKTTSIIIIIILIIINYACKICIFLSIRYNKEH